MRRGKSRVLGPYREPSGSWRIVVIEGGRRTSKKTSSQAEAEAIKKELSKELAKCQPVDLPDVLGRYAQHLAGKGNKPASVSGTIGKLTRALAGVSDLAQLTPRKAATLYDRLSTRPSKTGRPLSTDSHRNILAECKTFGRWCAKSKLLTADPFAAVEGVGRRSHGKPQLRIDEARRFCSKAHELAIGGDVGAVAALVTLLLGLRASEIVERVARDVDDGGRLLWIPDSKTRAGRRQVEIPEELRGYFAAMAIGCKPGDRLFGEHWRDWPRKQVQRICKLARVPEVCAHSMRGLHSTLAIQAGASPHLVAASLGHEKSSTTIRSYAAPGSYQIGQGRAARDRLADIIPIKQGAG